MTQAQRFMAAVEKHASEVTLEMLVDFARALGFRLRVELIVNEKEPTEPNA